MSAQDKINMLEEAEPTRHIPGGQIVSFIDERPYMPADEVRRMQVIAVDTEDSKVLAGFILKPQSTGSVTIASKDPLMPAQVRMNMYSLGMEMRLDKGGITYITIWLYFI
jgi:hypothetical protein